MWWVFAQDREVEREKEERGESARKVAEDGGG
jgi:hypothetical protein